MNTSLDQVQYNALVEAKAALARHGIVIIRSIESDLEPAIMSAARDSISSSPAILNEMDEDELDRFMEGLRKAAMKSAKEIRELYIRLIAQLGTEYLGDLVKELDGIGKLFTWGRIAESVQPVNRKLAKKGFRQVKLAQAEEVSVSLALELEGKWPEAFDRFKRLATDAAKVLECEATRKQEPPKARTPPRKKPSSGKKAKKTTKGTGSSRKR